VKRFDTFSLDGTNQCIWRGDKRIALPPKAFAVLSYLVANSDRLVTKEELLDAVWPNTFVQEAVLKVCILDVRKALGESPRNPEHIVTEHRRGYRFVSHAGNAASGNPRHSGTSTLLGRQADLERLHDLMRRSAASERQIVFITGEPGIGKSTLVDHFVHSAAVEPVLLMKAQCIEHFGSSEAYYPIFQALARAAKTDAVANLIPVLRKYAPTWLAEMPGFTSAADEHALKAEILGATRERMVREMAEAIEALAAEQPLIFVLEDLHWSDVSTLDLVSAIANRSRGTRLLLVATYRPVDAILNNHPVKSVKQTLLARGQCVELELELLRKHHVAELLERRFPNHDFPPAFVDLVFQRTDGNPLFVTNMLDYAAADSLIVDVDGRWRLNSEMSDVDLRVPESLAQMIEAQIDRLTAEEQGALETASAAGLTFAASLMAGRELQQARALEECCDALVKRGLFIRSTGLVEFGPDRISARYQFTHAIYRDIIYRRLSPARRIRLHRAIGEQIELALSGRIDDAAADLALHFQECRDYGKAIHYLRVAAQRSATRHALSEALAALMRAAEICEKLSEQTRSETELNLVEQIGLLYRLMGQLPLAADQFEKMSERAHRRGDYEAELRAQFWLASVTSWLDRTRCLKAVDAAIALCDTQPESEIRANALGHSAYWNLLFRGWTDHDAAASAAALDAARQRQDQAFIALHANRHAFFQALSSHYREACQTAEEGVRIAVEIESLIDYSIGHFFEGWASLHLGEWGLMRRLLSSAMIMTKKNGHDLWTVLFGLLDAFLHLQTFSFDRARQMCENYVTRARELGHQLSVQIALVLLGLAELGLGNLAGADARLHEVREWQNRERILMDWIWQMPLQLGLTELALARGDLSAARREAELFLSITAKTAERTWIALAHYARASVALAEHDRVGARLEVSKGLAVIEGYEAPLAAWRLHALAARIDSGSQHQQRAEAVIRELAETLPDDDDLRDSLLSSALGRAASRA
jgi:DNA-binding winged helix-turn-helix (wHTH) protein